MNLAKIFGSRLLLPGRRSYTGTQAALRRVGSFKAAWCLVVLSGLILAALVSCAPAGRHGEPAPSGALAPEPAPPPGPPPSRASRPPAPGAAPVVCLDPGHPSEINSGRAVQHGVTELDMNWQVSQKLAAILERQYGVKVVMTRTARDRMTTNQERAEVANAHKAALFLRLHCDTGKGSGFTVYYPDRQGKKQGQVGPPVAVLAASRQAAQAIHAGLAQGLGGQLKDNGARSESGTYIGRKQGALTGSIFSLVPVVTVEMVFLSNQADAAFIKSPAGQEQMAQALARGVMKFLQPLARPR